MLPLSHQPGLPTAAYRKVTEAKLRLEVKTDRGSTHSIIQVLLFMVNAFVLQRDSSFVAPERGWAPSAWNPWPHHSLRAVLHVNKE